MNALLVHGLPLFVNIVMDFQGGLDADQACLWLLLSLRGLRMVFLFFFSFWPIMGIVMVAYRHCDGVELDGMKKLSVHSLLGRFDWERYHSVLESMATGVTRFYQTLMASLIRQE
jgi:hypothetical protein